MNEPLRADPIVHDTPVPSRPGDQVWGSDYIAAVLRSLEIPYIALVPGSSYRGFHDSMVNYLGNRAPQMVLTIHEENAVAIAHDLKLPILYVGVGEGIDDLIPFSPQDYVDALFQNKW